jgi:hypothetical protein
MLGIEAWNSSKNNFINVEQLRPMAQNYAINFDALRAQAASIRAILATYDKDSKPKIVAEVLKLIECFRVGFEESWCMLQIAATVPALRVPIKMRAFVFCHETNQVTYSQRFYRRDCAVFPC